MHNGHWTPEYPIVLRSSTQDAVRHLMGSHRRDFGIPPLMQTNGSRAVFMGRHKWLRCRTKHGWRSYGWLNTALNPAMEWSVLERGKHVPLDQAWHAFWDARRDSWPFLIHSLDDMPLLNMHHIPSGLRELLCTLPAEHFAAHLLAMREEQPLRYDPDRYAQLQQDAPWNGYHTLLERVFFETPEDIQRRFCAALDEYSRADDPGSAEHETLLALSRLREISALVHSA